MADDFDPATVPIRNAATVMLVRDSGGGEGGIEVFMLRRTADAAFGAGMYVFPGGKVDDADHADELEPFCVGLDDPSASRQLGLRSGGLAYWVASIRECFEEAGILLATRRDGSPPRVDDDARHDVHDGSLSMVDLCRREDLVLDLSTTHYVDHWITPLGERRRFDTRFFVAEAPEGQDGGHDDKETVASGWVRPATALDLYAAGDLMMMPPTVKNLRWLSGFATAKEAVAAGAAITDPPSTLPKIRLDDAGNFVELLLPGDAEYDRV
jgi:8-oxo-dGTP pyrophosphatase MutT (NUDIX family)